MLQKKMLMLSILLMIGGVFGNILFTRLGYFPNADFWIMSIPLAAGAHYFNLGLVLLAMTMIGLILLPLSVKERQFSKTVLSLVLITQLPYAI